MESSSRGAVVTWVDRAAGPGPLRGLRLGVKDVIAVEGVPRLCGAPGFVDDTPQPRDATCVARLVADGALLVATTTTHQLSYGVTTPGVSNPVAPDRIAGGSSGGSAAALATGLVDGALGTDTAGSVRIPAACCGLTALKPTEGIVPRDGVQPLSPTLDTVGPMARDVATLTAMLSSLAAAEIRPRLPAGLRVGVVEEAWESRLHDEVRTAWAGVLDVLRGQGARTAAVSIPQWDESHRAAGRIIAREAWKLHRDRLRRHAEALDPDVRVVLESGASL
ncbi:MAG: Asp-tRNA(Asn)/Glu-tRNA(Gln) amidotransferase GatCAB subunit A, partial [Nitriliruptorales bacterium]|nr:Asp-tRNA(Asn)/Glu-tRNA(Gln) amidotransferase GatCAB subunit A [Nitriliruptorales bacterium]